MAWRRKGYNVSDQEFMLLRPSLFRTLLFVAITATAFLLVDSVLANTERRETALEAARYFNDGERLIRQGKYADAADAFRSAIANARDNADYRLALGEALLDAKELDEAGATLTDLLKSDSMAGAPNLAMARVFAKEGRFDEAASWYHRAIYGKWKGDAAGNQAKARFELADFLATRNSKAELLAELLPLQEQASQDAATQTRLARLYMTAGAPARAATIFRTLAHAHPGDFEAREELAAAEFAVRDFPAAQSDLIAALRLRPDDDKARSMLELCDQVLNLDPLRRGLDGQERYRRSLQVLQLVADKAAQCPASSDLMDEIQAALKSHVQTTAQSAAVETNLELAGKLWQSERTKCAWDASTDEPLQLVLAKAAQ
jgi:tetratricopeptide (TPR) repeat protein